MSADDTTSIGLGLEETSQGALNPADDIQARPSLEEVGGLDLGSMPPHGDDNVLEIEHLFGQSPIFEGLEKIEIREIINRAVKVPLQAGQPLFMQGDQADALFILHSGEVQVRAHSQLGEDIVLAVLGSGTIVGELALIDGGPRSATVEALSDCDIYMLDRPSFEALRHERNPAAYKVILNLASTVDARRRQTEARINEVFEDPAQHIDLFESQVHDMLARLRKA